jgi:DNA-binding NtrC family response regulator
VATKRKKERAPAATPSPSAAYLSALAVSSPATFAGIVDKAMQEHAGNRTKAAEALGVNHKTLRKWLRELDVLKPVRERYPAERVPTRAA